MGTNYVRPTNKNRRNLTSVIDPSFGSVFHTRQVLFTYLVITFSRNLLRLLQRLQRKSMNKEMEDSRDICVIFEGWKNLVVFLGDVKGFETSFSCLNSVRDLRN